jgi:hypothetical protein
MIYSSVRLSACPSIRPTDFLFVCSSVRLSVRLSICWTLAPLICLRLWPPGHLLVRRSVFCRLLGPPVACCLLACRHPFSCRPPGPQLGAGLAEGEQRTDAWHKLRDARLTASAFCNAMGFFNGGRVQLWEEKVRPEHIVRLGTHY